MIRTMIKTRRAFTIYLRILIIYTLTVILWGAWVRISHSGDGCGASWPLCHNQVIPLNAPGKTWTEFTHRIMSGLYGILVIWGLLSSRLITFKNPKLKFWMTVTFVFMISEALLGAKLVLFGLVGQNSSLWRSISMALHFTNSLILVACTTKTYLHTQWPLIPLEQSPFLKVDRRWWKRGPLLIIGLLILTGLTGTIAALANTLFPVENLLEGLRQDLDPNSHFLIRWRGLHPVLGWSIGIGSTLFLYYLSELVVTTNKHLRTSLFIGSILFAAATLAGTSLILFHSPTWIKLLHLSLIYSLWVTLIAVKTFTKYQLDNPKITGS